MRPIEIVVGDSEYISRQGLKSLVSECPQMHLMGSAVNSNQLIELIKEYKPDVAIIDYNSDGFDQNVILAARNASMQTRIMAISADDSKTSVFNAVEMGVHSFVTKKCSREEIISGIMGTSRKERFFCNRILEMFVNHHLTPDPCEATELTAREIEILQLTGEGLSTKEIAEQLSLSTHTIYTHRKNMMRKLKVNSGTDLILTSIEMGIIKPRLRAAGNQF